MNAALKCFDFEELPVRVLEKDGQPWFVAADVCRVLELTNPTESVRGLDDDEINTLRITEGIRAGNPNVNVVSESGLYALIFKSRKPQARKFRKWVTAEVLPALRESGRYEMEAAAQASTRGQLARLRQLLLDSAEGVHAGSLTPGKAQAIALAAQRYLETLKLEGEAIGYEKVLGLRPGEAGQRILPGRERVPGMPQRPLPGAQAGEPGVREEAPGGEEALGEAAPGQAGGLREEVPAGPGSAPRSGMCAGGE